MTMELNELIKNVKGQIEDCKVFDDDLSRSQWDTQQGVLLSANDAILLITEIEKHI